MPSKRYAFAPGQAPRVEITWRGKWKGTKVSLDGVMLGPPIEGTMEMLDGRRYPLADGSVLSVQLQVEQGSRLVVERDGYPLTFVFVNSSNPLKFVTIAMGFVGTVMMIAGLLPVIAPDEYFGGITPLTLVAGLVMIAMAIMTFKARSALAHSAALVVFIAETVYGYTRSSLDIEFLANTIQFRIVFAVLMAFGFLALKKARSADALNRQIGAF